MSPPTFAGPSILAGPWPIRRFDEIDSTNEHARRLAATGDVGPVWLTARSQTAGRGRQGRQWTSPLGNLFATALFEYPGTLAEGSLAPFAAGLAVIDAAGASGVETFALRLKWPNDIEAGPAKLAGILIETGAMPGKGVWMAAGFGVNIAEAPARPDRETACLRDLPGGAGLTVETFLPLLDTAFRARLAQLAGGFEATRADWLAQAGHMGARILVKPASGPVEGRMVDVEGDGALVLELDDGSLYRVRAGEIAVMG